MKTTLVILNKFSKFGNFTFCLEKEEEGSQNPTCRNDEDGCCAGLKFNIEETVCNSVSPALVHIH